MQAEEQQSDSDLLVLQVGMAKSTHPITVVVEVDDRTRINHFGRDVEEGVSWSLFEAFHHPSEDLHG